MNALPPQLAPANAIHDPVHGRIWLTRVEMDLINTPEFQRLRGIGQLTPVDLVFPGATHNRFAHSIGAAHVLGMIANQEPIAAYFSGDREPLVQILRLAALLHDVGHLPFSHVGEMAWLAAARPDAFRYHDEPDGPFTVFDVAASARAHQPLHEEFSALLITESRLGEVIDRALDPVDGEPASQVVERIIRGTHADVVVRNLLSSDLDCDRLDYLLRDSLTAGLVYGHIDLAYLIGALVIAQDGQGPTIAIDERHGLLTGEHFLLARYYHYAQYVTHKTVAAAEVALVAAILELIRLGRLPATDELIGSTTDPSTRTATLMTLTDAHVEAKIASAVHDSEHGALADAARRLVERKLPKVAARDDGLAPRRQPGEGHSHNWDRLLAPANKQRTADDCGVDPRKFCYRRSAMPLTGVPGDMSPADALRDQADLQARVRKAAKVTLDGSTTNLLIEKSFVLRELSAHEWTTRRVLALEPFDSYNPRHPSDDFETLRAYFMEAQ
jgi:HD superfamily phosphohydrolase